MFASGWKSKGVLSNRSYSHKSLGKSTDAFNIEKRKYIWSMNPGANLEMSMVGPLGILFALVKRKIRQGYSKSGIFVGTSSMSPFLAIRFILTIETQTKSWSIIWMRFFYRAQTVGTTIFLFLWGLTLPNLDLKIFQIVLGLVRWFPRTTLRVWKSQSSIGSDAIFWKPK